MQKIIPRCKKCKKEVCDGTIKGYANAIKGTEYIGNAMKEIFFCCYECKIRYELQFIVEYYGYKPIYKVNGRYLPYFGCHYYFDNIEDCRKRMDVKNIGICP